MNDKNSPARALELPAPLGRALVCFAQTTRALIIRRACGWVVFCLLTGFSLLACADRWLLLGDGTRQFSAAALYLASSGLAALLLRKALRPQPIAEIALALERCAPGELLHERFSTTVELATEQTRGEGLSAAMVEEVAREASLCAEKLDVGRLPSRTGARRARKFAAASILLVALLCLAPGLSMPLAYARAALPWLNLKRASSTQIEVLTGSVRIVDGESVSVMARIAPAAEAQLETRQTGEGWQRLRMDSDPAQPGQFALQLGPLHQSLQYRVAAGDGLSAAYAIAILPRPEVTAVKLVVNYPGYTGLEQQTFNGASGDIAVPQGSRVALEITSNTDLAAAVMEFPEERRLSMAVKGKVASGAIEVTADTSYRVRLRSRDDVSNPDAPLFFVRALPVSPPVVAVFKPQPDEAVDLNAVLPLEARAEDEWALMSMRLMVQHGSKLNPLAIPLERPAGARKVWLISQPWDLSGMFLEGDEAVSYWVEAVNSYGSVGRSGEQRLRLAAGPQRQQGLLLRGLEEAQQLLSSAEGLLSGAERDAAQMRLVFRADDAEFQAAERLLLAQTMNQVAEKAQSASRALSKILPHAETGPLQNLLDALAGNLSRFADTSMRPLSRAAGRARLSEGQTIAASLDAIAELLPDPQKRLSELHSALTAAQRYAGASVLEQRAVNVNETQTHIVPVLVGTAGWTPDGSVLPGVLATYFEDVELKKPTRCSIENAIGQKSGEQSGNLNARWQGQFLAATAGRYLFQTTEDGLRLSLDNKPLLDRGKAPQPEKVEPPPAGNRQAGRNEAAVELSAGWHAITVENISANSRQNLGLACSGPGLRGGPLPNERLRTPPLKAASLADGRMREAMGKAASETAVKCALVRLQTGVETERALPPELCRLAALSPQPDAEGQRQGEVWRTLVQTQTQNLDNLKAATPLVAEPLLRWPEHTAQWAANYRAVRERYRLAMLDWAGRLANDVFKFSAALRQLEKNAASAQQAYHALANIFRQPPDPKRDLELAKTGAAVRALGEDLHQQAADIARELRAASQDSANRPEGERRALQALAQRADAFVSGPAAALDRRLAEAKTVESLAKSEEKIPNFGTNAEELRQKAGELAQLAERLERAVGLRDSLQKNAAGSVAARDALNQPPSPEAANLQKHAGAEIKEATEDLKRKIQEAVNAVSPQALNQSAQAANEPLALSAADRLEKEANEILAAKKEDPAKQAEAQKARSEMSQALGQKASVAQAAAGQINKELAELGRQLEGDPAAALREAAKSEQETAKAAAEFGQAKEAAAAKPALEEAAGQAETAREKAARASEQLAGDAETMHTQAQNQEQHAQADDLTRLAAAVRHELKARVAPTAEALDRARAKLDPPKNTEAQAKASTEALNKLAGLADKLNSPDPKARKEAHDALAQMLKEDGVQSEVEAALRKANALAALAKEVAENAPDANHAAPTSQPSSKDQTNVPQAAPAGEAAAQLKKLENEERELAGELGQAQDSSLPQLALAGQLSELASDLRKGADHETQIAGNLKHALSMEEQAREKLEAQEAELAKAIRKAGEEAAETAKQAQAQVPRLAGPLNEAQKTLPQSADGALSLAKQARSKPLDELGDLAGKLAADLEKPSAAIAANLDQPENKASQEAQKIGQELRQDAGQEADLAEELHQAARAEQLAHETETAASGSRAQLEKEVNTAIAAMDQLPAVADIQKDLAALRQAAGGQHRQPAASQPNDQMDFQQAQAAAERFLDMAAHLDQIAGALNKAHRSKQQPAPASDTLAAEALADLADARAALQTGAMARSNQLRQEASEELSEAAEAALNKAAGQEAPGSDKARNAQNGKHSKSQKSSRSGKSHGGRATGQSQEGSQAEGAGLASAPPKGLPLDLATWNRLPDDIRRDMLNASAGRFPPEFEMSIRRYFKNIAVEGEKP